ncbi:hypothetical protein QT971_01560 [Microcoleus sp. herbarium19]|uniref:hypothetical protein n=1 Tax=unclassified Microcoleus TaxID=2642155 RepID=UPI002FD09F00
MNASPQLLMRACISDAAKDIWQKDIQEHATKACDLKSSLLRNDINGGHGSATTIDCRDTPKAVS